jgi:branched-chain amino acid transport system substrate-binding protein
MIQAGCYAGTLHYLKAVQALGLAKAKADGTAVVTQMKATRTSDGIFEPSTIRADGRALFPVYLLQAKAPKDVKGQWDLLDLVATTPGDEAWRPLAEGGCALTKA